MIVCVSLSIGNWFEDRYLESEGTDLDPVMRPFDGPEEPLVGATKGLAHAIYSAKHLWKLWAPSSLCMFATSMHLQGV